MPLLSALHGEGPPCSLPMRNWCCWEWGHGLQPGAPRVAPTSLGEEPKPEPGPTRPQVVWPRHPSALEVPSLEQASPRPLVSSQVRPSPRGRPQPPLRDQLSLCPHCPTPKHALVTPLHPSTALPPPATLSIVVNNFTSVSLPFSIGTWASYGQRRLLFSSVLFADTSPVPQTGQHVASAQYCELDE